MTPEMSRFIQLLLLLAGLATLAGCDFGSRTSRTGEELGSDDARQEAFRLVEDANQNIRSIKVLYRDNSRKISDLEAALKAGDLKKVKDLAEDLMLAINDGYLLADSIIAKLEAAQELDINSTWKRYLALKQESLELQIRAFDYRKNSAELFRDKIGAENQDTLKLARDTFKKNEEGFKKYMAEAETVSKEADEIRKSTMGK